jgi:D-3-phosphoglycerate dehydrogenase
LDHCLVPAVVDSDIVVCSASGLFANQVAEQTLALLFGVLRRIPVFFRQFQQREFVRRPTDDLRGKSIGIVGLGGNGRRLVQVLAPFDVVMRATDYYPVKKPPEVAHLWPADRLKDLASVSDILILCLPLNATTFQIINEEIIRAMPRGSYLINVARGQVVDEEAMIGALNDGQLCAAGLDVTFDEPPAANSPLWGLDNLLITPHVGAQAASRVDDSTELACTNLMRYFAGQQLLNVVDKRLGFPHPEVMVASRASG